MLAYPEINPVAIQIGPLAVHWYGLMYLIGFFGAWGFTTLRVKHSNRGFTPPQVSDLLFYCAMGVVIGGRLGYMVFYDWYDLIHQPLRIFMVWKGGMSFHGGVIGVIIAIFIYAKQNHKAFGDVGDLIVVAIPIGLATGRLGNFINSELWGRVTDMPWGMVFPNGGNLPRHPSQLYECFLEGIVLFAVLWWYSSKPKPRYAVSGLFLLLYGIFRFSVEFFREPDKHIGYLAYGFTEGQYLCIPMILIGASLMTYAYRRKPLCDNI